MAPLTFLAGAAVGAGTTWAARRYLTHRAKQVEGVADRLLWALFIAPGVILQKDGTFLSGFRFRGRDLESAPEAAVHQAAANIRKAIGQAGAGFSFEVNVHRTELRQYPGPGTADFPSRALREVDEERRRRFTRPATYFETSSALLVSFTPPRESVRKIEQLFLRGRGVGIDYRLVRTEYQQALDELQAQLAATLDVARLDSTQLATECHQCLTGDPRPVAAPSGYLNYAMATGDFEPAFTPRFDQDYIYVVTITGWGESVPAGAGEFVNDIADTARWHLRFLGYNYAGAERRIRAAQKNWFSQRKGLRAFMPGGGAESVLEDPHAVAMQQDTGAAIAELSSGRSRFGLLSNAILIRDSDLARGRHRADELLQRIRDAGMTGKVETANAVQAFWGSLPGHGAVNCRRHIVSSRQVSHLFPVTAPWPGRRTNPSPLMPADSPSLMVVEGRGSTPFRLNLHHQDVPHTLVVGATGAGKSVLVGSLMMSWLRYPNARVYCFDVGRSHLILTRAAGGDHVDMGSEQAPGLQPLRDLETDTDRLWAEAWITALCALQSIHVAPEDRLGIERALGLLARERPEHRTLTTLRVNLPQAVAAAVQPYTLKGPYGRLFDGVQAASTGVKRMRTVELGDVLSLGDAVIAPLLMALFRQVERALDGTPTLIMIEEAWAALLRSDFASRMQRWLLTLRKQNAGVVIVAHSPSQIHQLPNASIITESCPTRILLPNAEARVAEHAEVYRFLDLGQREIDTIATAQPKKEYYFRSPEGSRVFDLALDRRARALLMPLPGMTVERSRACVMAAMEQHGDDFLNHLPLEP